MEKALIPPNIEGKQTDLTHTVTLDNSDDAIRCFQRAAKRLQNPPIWHELCGALSAEFTLVSGAGKEARRLANVNDYFKIDIPGPGPKAGNGYDWVKVELVEDHSFAGAEEESCVMRVRPCSDPEKHNSTVAHFFQKKATSTFIIHRLGNTITASYHGRNELPNNDTEFTTDNIRNSIIASGALSGLSEAQWLSLLKAFLQEEIGG